MTMQAVLLLLYPLNVYLGILLDIPVMQVIAIITLSAGLLYQELMNGNYRLWLIFILVVLTSFGVAYFDLVIYFLYLPPVLIPLLVFSLFFRSLLPGNTPFVTAIAAQSRGELTEELSLYTRHVTIIWAIILGLLTIEAILFPWLVSDHIWSLFTNIINYVVIALMFVGEYIVRRVRFRDYEHPGFIQYLQLVFRANVRKL